jgi:hypothetical protein
MNKDFIKNIILEQLDQLKLEDLNLTDFRSDPEYKPILDALKKGKIVSLAFVKKDNTVRHMAAKRFLSSYKPSTAQKVGGNVDKQERNNIIVAIDINAYHDNLKKYGGDKEKAATASWRSFPIYNVLGFMAGGVFYDLRDVNNILERYGEEIYNSLTKSMISSLDKKGVQVWDSVGGDEENNDAFKAVFDKKG